MDEKRYNINKVIPGVCADILTNAISHPLNTLKVNKQLGKPIKMTIKNMRKGFVLSNINEALHATIFYSIFEGFNCFKNTHPFTKSVLGSTIACVVTHPLSRVGKMQQASQFMRIKNVSDAYVGLSSSILRVVPGVALTYTLRDNAHQVLHDDLKPIGTVASSLTSILLTYPLDTLYTNSCFSKKIISKNMYKGLHECMIEKNISITGKMLLLDIFALNQFK